MVWLVLVGAVVAALALAVAVVLGLRSRFAIVNVTGPSMEPTLRHGDRLLVRRASPDRLRTGDIVVIETPGSPVPSGPDPAAGPGALAHAATSLTGRLWIVKRVAAGPGDPVPAALSQVAGVTVGAPVPADRFVLLGDNPAHSVDSRTHGFYRGEHILGVMVRPMR